MSDDNPTGQPGDRQPLPKFPWEEGYVAPGTDAHSADTPTERFDAQAAANPTPPAAQQPAQPQQPAPFDPDQPTELFDVQQPAPTERFTTQPPPNLPTFIPQQAAPPINPEPTERFDALPSDDPFAAGGLFAPDAFVDHSDDLIPTERFVAAEPTYSAAATTVYPTRGSGGAGGAGSAGGGGRRATPPPKKSNALLWTLVSIAGVLLITIIVLAIILLQPKDTPAPVDSPTAEAPIEEPEPEPSESEEPEATGPIFDSFTAPETSGCTEDSTEAPLEFSWESSNAVRAYIGVGTDNARDDPFDGDLPPTYTYLDIVYLCDQESQIYTVTLEDESGEIASETVTVSR